MASPHISGIVALLKSVHPIWIPAAIKSALVTTASVRDEYDQHVVAEGAPYKQGNPFDYGGGHVNPNKAIDPGLIFNMNVDDHIHFLCSMGYNISAISLMTQHRTICHGRYLSKDLNLPSIPIPELKGNVTVSRTVTNVGPVTSTYHTRLEASPGVTVLVIPSVLTFNSTVQKLSFHFNPESVRKILIWKSLVGRWSAYSGHAYDSSHYCWQFR